jgi:FdhD protein
MTDSSLTPFDIEAWAGGQGHRRSDVVATEEPLEIRVADIEGIHPVSVTMRTPGADFELAAGFLFTEGIVPGRDAIELIAYCSNCEEPQRGNVVNVFLAPDVPFDPARLSRNVYTTSSCGICGKTSIDQVRTVCRWPLAARPKLPADLFLGLPEVLRRHQEGFERSGGLHAAAFFDASGELLDVREDIGRHNAMDKLIGSRLMADRLPASDVVALVSGRVSFELVQKALMAGVPVLAAVSAPSSLAIDLARESGMTLIGFLRDGRFNVYAGEVEGSADEE